MPSVAMPTVIRTLPYPSRQTLYVGVDYSAMHAGDIDFISANRIVQDLYMMAGGRAELTATIWAVVTLRGCEGEGY